MNRREFLEILKRFCFGEFRKSDYIIVLTQYCIEHNKPKDKIDIIIPYIISNPLLLNQCYTIALHYYENKFNICKLYGKLNMMNSQLQGRNLLQIF